MVEYTNVLMIKMNTKHFLTSFNTMSTSCRERVTRENAKTSLIRDSYTITMLK